MAVPRCDARGGGIDLGHIEVKEPDRGGKRVGLVHHAVDWLAPGREQLVGAHRAHVDGLRLGPAELTGVVRRTGPPCRPIRELSCAATWRACALCGIRSNRSSRPGSNGWSRLLQRDPRPWSVCWPG